MDKQGITELYMEAVEAPSEVDCFEGLRILSNVMADVCFLTLLAYRNSRTLPPTIRESVSPEIYDAAYKIARNLGRIPGPYDREDVQDFFLTLPPSKCWPFFVPDAIFKIHGVKNDGFLERRQDLGFQDVGGTGESEMVQVMPHLFSLKRGEKYERFLRLGNNVATDMSEAIAGLLNAQVEIISTLVHGHRGVIISPEIFHQIVSEIMESDKVPDITQCPLLSWLPDQVEVARQVYLEDPMLDDQGKPMPAYAFVDLKPH